MDQSKQSPMPVTEGVNDATLVTYASQTHPQAGMITPGSAVIGSMPSATQQTAALPPTMDQLIGQHQLAYQQIQQFHQQQQHHQMQMLQAFWATQTAEIERTTDFKNQNLPLARIKKIMKADEDVRMISAEAPVIFAKACDLFILDLTLRAWIHTEENKRRTLQKNDIAAAITRTDIFDFLVDIVPRDELKDEGLGIGSAGLPSAGTGDPGPYYFVPMQPQVASPGMTTGKLADRMVAAGAAATAYAAQQYIPNTYMWQQPQLPLQHQPPQDQDAPEAD